MPPKRKASATTGGGTATKRFAKKSLGSATKCKADEAGRPDEGAAKISEPPAADEADEGFYELVRVLRGRLCGLIPPVKARGIEQEFQTLKEMVDDHPPLPEPHTAGPD